MNNYLKQGLYFSVYMASILFVFLMLGLAYFTYGASLLLIPIFCSLSFYCFDKGTNLPCS